MDKYEILDDKLDMGHQLAFTPSIKTILLKSAKWAKILGILGLIFLLSGVFMRLFDVVLLASFDLEIHVSKALFLLYIIIVVALALPMASLHEFGKNIEKAIRQNSQPLFQKAFKNQYRMLKIYGITIITMIALYMVGILLYFDFSLFF